MISIVLDVIVVLIILLTVMITVKKGFAKTFMIATRFIVAVAAAFILLVPAKMIVMKTPLASYFYNKTDSIIEKSLSNADLNNPDAFINKLNDPKLKDSIGTFVDIEKLKDQCEEWRDKGEKSLKESAVKYIAEPLTNITVTAVAFIVVFLIAYIAVTIAIFAVDLVAKLPFLKTVNKLLAYPLGIVLALFRVYLFCALFGMLLPFLQASDNQLLSQLSVEYTYIFEFFYTNNLLLKIAIL